MLSWHGRNRGPKNLCERKVNFQRAEESINLWRQVGIEKYLEVVLFMSLKILRNYSETTPDTPGSIPDHLFSFAKTATRDQHQSRS